ncbi:MAG TPA: PilZ domain-containing protein [Verrucomicrobiae bacterium]|nr:PilZ domain-containing protein [Verrucomicrobiae bacterium]
MPQETNEGVAYLQALKRTTDGDGTAAAPALDGNAAKAAPAAVAGARPAEQYQGSEKRRSPRYKCEGSVQMREAGAEVHTWAAFTDISMHGCYVEAQATYPVGTDLLLKLEVNGIKVETKGNVRVSYPYLGMGIAFVEMTEDQRSRLKDLVASILRPRVIVGPGMASTIPAMAPLEGLPEVTNPQAALQAVMEFFQHRQMLMREDFVRVVRTSQSPQSKA